MNHYLDALLNGALGALGLGALPAYLSDPWGTIRDEFLEPFQEWAQDFIDNVVPSAYQESLERVKDLAEAMDAMDDFFNDVGQAINDALDSGETPPQTDGGLGETYDNFSPDGEVPFNVGTIPGFSSDSAGMNRNEPAGGGGGWSGPAPGGGSSPSHGGDPAGSSPAPDPANHNDPSLQDLGVDPGSGAYVEYQPSEGRVVIHYPDGTTEVRPWP